MRIFFSRSHRVKVASSEEGRKKRRRKQEEEGFPVLLVFPCQLGRKWLLLPFLLLEPYLSRTLLSSSSALLQDDFTTRREGRSHSRCERGKRKSEGRLSPPVRLTLLPPTSLYQLSCLSVTSLLARFRLWCCEVTLRKERRKTHFNGVRSSIVSEKEEG